MASRAALAARVQVPVNGAISREVQQPYFTAQQSVAPVGFFERGPAKSKRRLSNCEALAQHLSSSFTSPLENVRNRVFIRCPSRGRQLVRAEASGNGAASAIKRPEYIPNRIDDPNYVRIFDTTLRDGEQSPGATMTSKEKLDVARQLARLGVDIIEAGFPRASPDDLEAVRSIAKEVGNAVDETGYVPVICGLARCNKQDIDAAWEGVRHAKRPRIHVFIATSEIHLEYKLKKTRDEVVQIAREMVEYCRSLGCNDIEFSPEDAGR